MSEKRGPGRPAKTERELDQRDKEKAKESAIKKENRKKKVEREREIKKIERQKIQNATKRRIKFREKQLLQTNLEQAGMNMEELQKMEDPLGVALYWANQRPVNIEDVNALSRRVKDYFVHCLNNSATPTKAGLRLAIGMSASSFSRICSGARREGSLQQAILLKAMDILEHQWETLMLESKIHPASGIFIGKNQFGYRDNVEVVTVNQQPLGETASAEELAKKYQKQLPKGIDTEFKEVEDK